MPHSKQKIVSKIEWLRSLTMNELVFMKRMRWELLFFWLFTHLYGLINEQMYWITSILPNLR